ncbi:MAG: hypothetical protein IPN33_26000, partial [Saprospiraceae bacterium]|nr:hypothetical protein [Saprospiraceae bacterium]
MAQAEVKTLFSNVGGPSTGIGSLGVGVPYKTEFTVQLKDKKELDNLRTEDYMLRLRQLTKTISRHTFFNGYTGL